MPLSVYTICVYGCAAIVLLALAVASGVNFLGIESPNGLQLYSPVVWLCLVGLAVGPQLIGHTSYNWALGYLPAATVSVALLGEPIGTTLLAFFILKEAPSIVELLGGALILAGIFLASRVTNQAK
jgi:drug/metabolite transporter (DMT)-like permease